MRSNGTYNYFEESLFIIDKDSDEAYELVSHVYIMDDGRSFVEYEKIRNERTEILKEMELGKYD